MKSALIGYTGFVGSNLAKQYPFDDLYNSKNIEEIRGKHYDLIVSAGAKAERWKANQNPEDDWSGIKKLLDCLKNVTADHFVLISTIDVYPSLNGANEDTTINLSQLTQAYGNHRYQMEERIKQNFPKTTIIRCPQLYGPGVKKGFVYDLIYDNALDFTHKDTLLQLYDIDNMWHDIQVAVKNNIPVINFAVEPITAKEAAEHARGMDFTTVTEKPPMIFHFLTKYDSIFGSSNGYLYKKEEVLENLKKFVAQERSKIKK